jgi:hypothetical protein
MARKLLELVMVQREVRNAHVWEVNHVKALQYARRESPSGPSRLYDMAIT